ncbi:MAG: valine--tRNA ligase [Gemmatimonadota bacterium]|nr:valine--tRNA ligase [Gemmatimonadota bacterium]
MRDQAVFEKQYDPGTVERTWYAFWEKKGFFKPEYRTGGKPFSVTIPPPNVTGELHMGHALQHAIHDAVVRWKRMQGHRTLCLPGTDHAGIATQMKVEQQLFEEEGKGRHDIGRDELLKRIAAWKQQYGGTILNQLREMGCSYDWGRERYTMENGYARAVLSAFVKFYERGWIYRGKRMVNWCPRCGTVISDLEVEDRENEGHLWHIRYPGLDGGPDVVVATTRPETMLGDTGVAVHPEDRRWQRAIGRRVMLPLMDRPIPIVADSYADPEMGSGAVKVTPAHDPNDYEIGLRHGLPEIQVIGFGGEMTGDAGSFRGMDRFACRNAVISALKESGLLDRIEDYRHMVPHHDKCGTSIEPLPMDQWFLAMKSLASQAQPALRKRKIRYVPDRFRAYSIDWLENIQDWCISRQIWWGHRIPVWNCEDCGEMLVRVDTPAVCDACGGRTLVQDPDVLDTWFSSALWPFATLGWPEQAEDLKEFHPTDLMITGRDILYLWVARMIMTAVEFVDEIPFGTVLVHPTVQTRDGKRMSKSLGTGIDPRELIDRYGADATRLSLLYQCGSSQDIRFDADVVDNRLQDSPITESCRNFCNKVWNAARFVRMNLDGYDLAGTPPPSPGDDAADRWILSQYNRTVHAVTASLEAYRFDEASRTLYEFVWNAFCDWYLEIAKVRLNGGAPEAITTTRRVLVHVLEGSLRLLHPMAPFISEALWQHLPHSGTALIVAKWPEADPGRFDETAEREMALLQAVVGAVRNIRGTMRVPPGRRADVLLKVSSHEVGDVLTRFKDYLRTLARVADLRIGADIVRPVASASAVLKDVEVFVPLQGLIDLEVERRRLQKEIEKLERLVGGLDRKLSNSGFLNNAPPEVIVRERGRHAEYSSALGRLNENLAAVMS